MVSRGVKPELLEELARLSEPLQERVLQYARSLSAPLPKGMTGAELGAVIERLSEVLSPADAREIGEIIERDCEQVDPNEW